MSKLRQCRFMLYERIVYLRLSGTVMWWTMWRGGAMETNRYPAGPEQQEQFSLVCITLNEQSAASVRRVARRVCRNVRQSDCVLYASRVSAVVLACTALSGAQAVARRLDRKST